MSVITQATIQAILGLFNAVVWLHNALVLLNGHGLW